MLTSEILARASRERRADGLRRPGSEPYQYRAREPRRAMKAALDLMAALVILALWILGTWA